MKSHFPEELLKKLVDKHKGYDDIRAEDYRLQRRVALALEARKRTRVYLDTNHWLGLRNVLMSRSGRPEYKEMLRELKNGVQSEKIVIPITQHLVEEVLRQRDRKTREATARLLGDLSDNVALVGFTNRVMIEFSYWIHSFSSSTAGKDLDPGIKVWSWATNLYGELIPQITVEDAATENLLLKLADDIAALQPVSSLIMGIPDERVSTDGPKELAERQNWLRDRWSSSESYSDAYVDECAGFLRTVWDDLLEHSLEWVNRMPFLNGKASKSMQLEHLIRLITATIQNDDLGLWMPAMQIVAGGNAAIRADRGRRFKGGDVQDLFHASAALPYCDVFVTDSSFRHLLTCKPLELDRRFSCLVLSSVEDVLDALPT